MAERRHSIHGMWTSRLAFILAVTGSAVGLGNIWKFPYVAGDSGGGAFVLIYLACVALVGLPIMMSEVLLGRRGRRNPITTMRDLGDEEAGQRFWQIVGWSGVIAGFLILSFYSVIAGWTLAYVPRMVTGGFANISPEGSEAAFGALVGDWEKLLGWHTLFMAMTVLVVARGVEKGLEAAVRYLMPALFTLLLVMMGYAMTIDWGTEALEAASGGSSPFMAGLSYLFSPDWSKVTPGIVIAALGQAFFTLSIGMGAVMTYGAYLPQRTSITNTTVTVVLADTAVAIVAGVIIFPIVFANGLDAGSGPGLVFQTLPLAFGSMAGGTVFGTLFFILLVFAAWTSSIGLIEPAVAWLVEKKNMTRGVAAWTVGGIIWILGLASIFSFNILSGFQPFGWEKTIFDMLDYLTSNIMLPMGGLLIAVFAGWVMSRNSTSEELAVGTGWIFQTWSFLTRYVAPLAVLAVFLNATGLLDGIIG